MDGSPTHHVLVRCHDRRLIEAGEHIAYDGPPNWKFEPLDEKERADRLENHADPARVLRENLRSQVLIRAPMSEADKARELDIRRRSTQPIRIA